MVVGYMLVNLWIVAHISQSLSFLFLGDISQIRNQIH